jgi:hypothetical protein
VSRIRNVDAFLLICISLILRSPVLLNIHNQCENINLISPAYFIHGGKWHVVPSQKIDVNDLMSNRLEFDSGQDILEGALIYRLQRRHTESPKPAQDESKHIQLLVAWRVEPTKESYVCALLVEHDKELDGDKLRRLQQKHWHRLDAWFNSIRSSWLLDITTVLKTAVIVMNEGYRWDIFISEWLGYSPMRPLWIDVER